MGQIAADFPAEKYFRGEPDRMLKPPSLYKQDSTGKLHSARSLADQDVSPMAITDPPQRTPESDDDDWLALLAGRPAPDASPPTRQETDLLRQAVLARQSRSDAALSDAALIQGRERLRFRLRRENPPPPTLVRSWWRHPILLAGLAAGLASLTLLPLLWPPEPKLPETGPVQESLPKVKHFRLPTVIRVDQPATAARALAESLNRLGIAAQPIQHAEHWVIDAQLPDPPPPGLAALLSTYRVRPPPDRRLLVEFAPQPAGSSHP